MKNIQRLLVLVSVAAFLTKGELRADNFYCESDCNQSRSCDYQCIDGGMAITCGDYNGGAENGMCSTCGDDICSQGENEDNCESDCALDADINVSFVWPNHELPWSKYSDNWPRQEYVGDCYGNCGPGCGEYRPAWGSVCNSPDQYWELELISGVTADQPEFACQCLGGSTDWECGQLTRYAATGRWTYRGWKASGCYVHDTTCRVHWSATFLLMAMGSSFVPGHIWQFISYELLASPYGMCKLSWASFAYGGLCLNSGPEEWSYETALYTDTFQHEYYEPRPPGVTCGGAPRCGDGICQSNTCDMGASGTTTPGDGCEELGGFNSVWCSLDCS
jgi:hypothetical protein